MVGIHTTFECECGANSAEGDIFNLETTDTAEIVVVCASCNRRDYVE